MGLFDFLEDEELRTQAQTAYDTSVAEINDSVQGKIDEAISGLKQKNEDLIGEKRAIQDKLKEFADIDDPVKALEALKLINENEEVRMIKDGKIEEVIEKRTSQLRSDQETTLTELKTQLQTALDNGDIFKSQFNSKMIEDSLRAAALKAGVRPEAVTDILLRGNAVFSLSTGGEIEARDGQGNLLKNKDKIIITPDIYVGSLKEEAPHYWPDSAGAGVIGGSLNTGDMQDKLAALADKGDMQGYKKLRSTMKE